MIGSNGECYPAFLSASVPLFSSLLYRCAPLCVICPPIHPFLLSDSPLPLFSVIWLVFRFLLSLNVHACPTSSTAFLPLSEFFSFALLTLDPHILNKTLGCSQPRCLVFFFFNCQHNFTSSFLASFLLLKLLFRSVSTHPSPLSPQLVQVS